MPRRPPSSTLFTYTTLFRSTLSGVPASKVFNGTFTPSASSDSGLAVAITVSGVCGGRTSTRLNSRHRGTCYCAVHGKQTGNGNYNAATEATQDVTATKAAQT